MEWIENRSFVPMEILWFLEQTFELYEIRGMVGNENGISFIVHSNERNHCIPHVHARYGEYEVSIDIITGNVLIGNIPKKNQKIAVDWVKKNRDKLLSDWKNIALSANTSMTMSGIQ